jgi:hypothetical protein
MYHDLVMYCYYEQPTLIPRTMIAHTRALAQYLVIAGLKQVGSCPESGVCVIRSLPVLLEDYRPDPNRLPAFVLALARDVEWGEEKDCFRNLAQVGFVNGIHFLSWMH